MGTLLHCDYRDCRADPLSNIYGLPYAYPTLVIGHWQNQYGLALNLHGQLF